MRAMALRRGQIVFACFVALFAWTTFIHWLPAFRLTPFAFVLGFITAVAGFLYIIGTFSRGKLDVIQRPPSSTALDFTSRKSFETEVDALKRRSHYVKPTIWESSTAISTKLGKLVDYLLRDFVKSWYIKISPSYGFTTEVDRVIRLALRNIACKTADLDLAEVLVTRVIPILNNHFKSFAEAERAVRGRNLNVNITEPEELDIAITARYRDGRLHPAASLGPATQNALLQQHLRKVVEKVLKEILPNDMTTSDAVLVLIREILACAVLQPVIQALSDPDVLNQIIEGYGRSVIHERKTVRKLRAALNEHATPAKRKPSTSYPTLTARDGEKTYEKFLRAISQCSSVPDARQFRAEVIHQIKKDTTKDPIHLRRLENGRKLLEHKLAELSSMSPVKSKHNRSESSTVTALQSSTLRQVLYNPAGLSYFMEYIDRQGLMALVQFWVVVDGMRNPLDSSSIDAASQIRSWTPADRQDILQISQAYIGKSELKVDPLVQKTVRLFLANGSKATWEQFSAARQALLSVQDDVYSELNENHFKAFQRSDLYLRWSMIELKVDRPQASQTTPENDITWSSPMHPRLETSQPGLLRVKQPDLRRVALSSGDLPSISRPTPKSNDSRRSLDSARKPLFDEEDNADVDSLANSTQSLGSDPGFTVEPATEQAEIVAAVQAALDDIVEEKPDKIISFADPVNSLDHSISPPSPRGSFDFTRMSEGNSAVASPNRVASPSGKDRPSLASLGLLGTPARPTVFNKDDLFGEGEKLWEDEIEDPEAGHRLEEEVHEAAPGDLGLAELVQSLTFEINKLEAQQNILDTLTRKAELTNNAAELKILRKSKTSLDREIRRRELQRQQYIVQEADNNLYARATIAIKSIMIGTEEDGHEFALYVIEVQRQAGEKSPAVTWAIARRYSEFHDLHKRLRAKYPTIRDLEFPRRQIVLTLQKDFLRKRRAALEKYIRELLARPQICRSIEFRAFLSQQAIRPITVDANGRQSQQVDRQDFITRIYNSVTDGMEEFLGNLPVLDQLSLAGANLITAATALPTTNTPLSSSATSSFINDPHTALEAEREITAPETQAASTTTTFIKPICDLFLELFALNTSNNWLRGRALVVVLQQLLGGTIERKVRDSCKSFTSEESLSRHIDTVIDLLWPNGTFRASPPVRTHDEKARSRKEAGLVLATLIPDLAGGVVGRSNAVEAARKICVTMNCEGVQRHLVLGLVDEMAERIFGIRV
jgi:sorting nexin-25